MSQTYSAVEKYYHLGAAASTWKVYNTGLNRYQRFCETAGKPTIPTSEDTLLLFTAHLATEGITSSIIKVYLSALRSFHVAAGKHEEFAKQLTPRLQQVIKGIRKEQAITTPPRTRLPITIDIMIGIQSVLAQQPGKYFNLMLWAACCMAFFGFLRSSEFTVPSQNQFDPSVHLTLSDISLDNRHQPQIVHITIKQSKTDPFRQGVTLSLGCTSHEICPVRAIVPFLGARGNKPGPLFILRNDKMLTREMFGSALDRILTQLHLNKEHFNTHSFRIGAATSAKQAGMSDIHIKMLGRWRSDAYQRYVRMSPTDLAGLSKKLIPSRYPSTHPTR